MMTCGRSGVTSYPFSNSCKSPGCHPCYLVAMDKGTYVACPFLRTSSQVSPNQISKAENRVRASFPKGGYSFFHQKLECCEGALHCHLLSGGQEIDLFKPHIYHLLLIAIITPEI